MKPIHHSLCGFTSRAGSWAANLWLYWRRDFHCRKKGKVLLSVPAHRADPRGTRVTQHQQQSAVQVGHSAQPTYSTLKDSLMWFISRGLFRILLRKPTSKWNSAGFVLCYCNLDLFLERCPQNFWALQQCKWFLLIIHFVKSFLKNQIHKSTVLIWRVI